MKKTVFLALASGLILLNSCSTPSERALEHAQEKGLVSDNVKERIDDLPFSASYLAPEYPAARTQYKKVYIKPIGTEVFEKTLDISTPEEQQKLAEQTKAFHKSLVDSIRKKAKGRVQVVDKPTKDALNLELHLVNLTRNNVVMNILSFMIPLPASSQVAHVAFQGRVDMAGKVTEPKAGKTVAEFFDHNPGKYSIYSVKDYQKYGHAKECGEIWREIFAKMFSEPKAQKVSAPAPVTLKPV